MELCFRLENRWRTKFTRPGLDHGGFRTFATSVLLRSFKSGDPARFRQRQALIPGLPAGVQMPDASASAILRTLRAELQKRENPRGFALPRSIQGGRIFRALLENVCQVKWARKMSAMEQNANPRNLLAKNDRQVSDFDAFTPPGGGRPRIKQRNSLNNQFFWRGKRVLRFYPRKEG